MKSYVRDVLLGITLLLCLIICAPGPASAAPGRDAPAGSCPQSIDNGCSTSPGGSIQIADFFTGYTGATYATRPKANMACVDYACGMPAVSNAGLGICGIDHIQDPATAGPPSTTTANPGCGIIPKGCQYVPAGIATRTIGSTFVCGPAQSADTTIKGFEMGPVGGHGGTTIYWFNTNPGALTIKYNRWLADMNNYRNGAALLTVNGSTSNITIEGNTIDGQWEKNFSNIAIFSGSVAANSSVLTVSAMDSRNTGTLAAYQAVFSNGISNAFIARQLTGTGGAPCPDPTCNGTAGTYQMTVAVRAEVTGRIMETAFQWMGTQLNTRGTIVQKYNYYHSINSRPTSGEVCPARDGTSGDELFYYNMFSGYLFTRFIADDGTGHVVPVLHGEVWQGTCAAPTANNTWNKIHYVGNVVYQPATALGPDTTTAFYLDSGSIPRQPAGINTKYANVLLQDNAVVSRNTGLGGEVFAEFGHHIFDSTTIARNYVDKTGATHGRYIFCNAAPTIGGAGGLSATGVNAFTTNPVLSGNMDLVSGENIDAAMIVYSNCGKP